MNKQNDQQRRGHEPELGPTRDRKPYLKPAFRREQVFETSALQCSKAATSPPVCQTPKTS